MPNQAFRAPTYPAIQNLLDGGVGLRVSAYLPVPARPGFDDVREFPERYQRLLAGIAKRLDQLGVAAPSRDELVRGLGLMDVELSSLHPETRGIAVFAGPGSIASFSLLEPTTSAIHVGRTYRLRPLLKSARRERRYRVIALSTNDVELFEGDARSLERVVPEHVPASLEEALGSELTDPTLQSHSSAGRGRAAMHHGHGGASRGRELDRDRFHHVLGAALKREWNHTDVPIVLVADRTHEGRFRKVAHLPALLEESVVGNPRSWSRDELHARVLAVVRAADDRKDQELLDEARGKLARGQGLSEPSSAALAAVSGRVDRVFVDAHPRVEGHIDTHDGSLHGPFGDEDVLDELCGLVLSRGGSALVHEDGMSTPHGLFAELRGT